MFPWSVMPSAGWPSANAACTRSPSRDAPSSMEYSVWVCRWVNDSLAAMPRPPRGRLSTGGAPWTAPSVRAASRATARHTNHSRVIRPTLAPGWAAIAGLARLPGPSTSGLAPGPRGATSANRGRALEVRPRPGRGDLGGARSGGQATLAHLLQLGPSRHLLGEQRGLDSVEESFEPPHQLRLGDAQLGFGRHRVVAERERHAVELGGEIGAQRVGELAHRLLVDLAQAGAAGL